MTNSSQPLPDPLGRDSLTTVALDAGPSFTITGPKGAVTRTAQNGFGVSGFYNGPVSPDFIPDSGGVFTFDNGSGAEGVQHFNSTLNFPANFTWTNSSAVTAIDRTQGVTVTWSGGDPGLFVNISGTSGATIAGTPISVSFTCQAPLSAGQFTVPPYVLLALPAGSGYITLTDSSGFQVFTAPGLDLGYLSGNVSDQAFVRFN